MEENSSLLVILQVKINDIIGYTLLETVLIFLFLTYV